MPRKHFKVKSREGEGTSTMTPEDLQQIRGVVHEEISARLDPAVEAIAAKIGASEERTLEAIAIQIGASEERTLEAIAIQIGASEERTLEAARAMQSEILRGLEAFARGNFARMHRIETSDADSNIRITALEERVLYLETRRPPQ
jgi:hypothetical protein